MPQFRAKESKNSEEFRRPIKSILVRLSIVCCATMLAVAPVSAGQLVYTPVNPSFGGSPFNGEWLFNNALTQDKGPGSTGSGNTNVNTDVDVEDLLGDIDTIIGIDLPDTGDGTVDP